MSYLLDTNILIDFFHGEKDAVDKLQSIEKEKLSVSVITSAEIYHGAHRTSLPQKHINDFESFLREFSISVITINQAIAKQYGTLLASLEVKGGKLSGFDVLIAATALEYNLVLISRDNALKRVEQLKIE